ncbi:hypothetical protein KUTeg_010073, partial [Tegillarca granosa]
MNLYIHLPTNYSCLVTVSLLFSSFVSIVAYFNIDELGVTIQDPTALENRNFNHFFSSLKTTHLKRLFKKYNIKPKYLTIKLFVLVEFSNYLCLRTNSLQQVHHNTQETFNIYIYIFVFIKNLTFIVIFSVYSKHAYRAIFVQFSFVHDVTLGKLCCFTGLKARTYSAILINVYLKYLSLFNELVIIFSAFRSSFRFLLLITLTYNFYKIPFLLRLSCNEILYYLTKTCCLSFFYFAASLYIDYMEG